MTSLYYQLGQQGALEKLGVSAEHAVLGGGAVGGVLGGASGGLSGLYSANAAAPYHAKPRPKGLGGRALQTTANVGRYAGKGLAGLAGGALGGMALGGIAGGGIAAAF
jgi:hypothetical protein